MRLNTSSSFLLGVVAALVVAAATFLVLSAFVGCSADHSVTSPLVQGDTQLAPNGHHYGWFIGKGNKHYPRVRRSDIPLDHGDPQLPIYPIYSWWDGHGK